MSEQQNPTAKTVSYRARHKGLDHLGKDDTKHGFEERIHGPVDRKESEPVFFGVCKLTSDEAPIFTTLTPENYQEAAKQRGGSRSLSRGARQATRPGPGQKSHVEADCSRGTQLHERRAICRGSGGLSVQKDIQGEADAKSMPLPSQSSSPPDPPNPVADAPQGSPKPHAAPPPPHCHVVPMASASTGFEEYTLRPPSSTVYMMAKDNGSGLGIDDKQRFHQARSVQIPPYLSCGEMYEGGQGIPYFDGAGSSTPFYLSTDTYNPNHEDTLYVPDPAGPYWFSG